MLWVCVQTSWVPVGVIHPDPEPFARLIQQLLCYEVGCFFGWLSIFKQILGHIRTFGCILWYYTVFCYYICSPKGHWDVTFLALALRHCIDKNVIDKTRLEVSCRFCLHLPMLAWSGYDYDHKNSLDLFKDSLPVRLLEKTKKKDELLDILQKNMVCPQNAFQCK